MTASWASGDVTRAVMAARPGKNVFHIGPERDLPIFDGLGLDFVPLDRADYVVCTGLRDDTIETPENYRAELELDPQAQHVLGLRQSGCRRRARRPSSSIARAPLPTLYRDMGGEVTYCGKPYRPIYDEALAHADEGARQGARAQSRDCDRRLGPHRSHGRREIRPRLPVRHRRHPRRGAGPSATRPDLSALNKMFADAGIAPKAVMSRLGRGDAQKKPPAFAGTAISNL